MREEIASALFALLNTDAMKATFKTISRRPRVWDESIEMPALYMGQPMENRTHDEGKTTPGKLAINFDVIFYINSGLDPNTIPDTEMNACVDAIENALTVGTMPGRPQTLGGLVDWVRVDGEIQRAPGYLDGRGAGFLTIAVLVP